MMSFFWSSGHIGWPFFSIVVFSVLSLLSGDIAWRVTQISSRKFLSIAAIVWVSGVTGLIAIWYV